MSRVARLEHGTRGPGRWFLQLQHGVPRAYLSRLADLAPINAAVTITVAALIAGFLLVHDYPAGVLLWLAAQVLLASLLLTRRRKRSSHRALDSTSTSSVVPDVLASTPTRRGLYRALAWAGLSGALWGALTAFLPDAPTHIQIVLILTMGGMAAGATSTLAAVPPAAALFILGCTAPATAYYFLMGGEVGITLALVFLVFMLAMIATSAMVFSSLERQFSAEWHVQELESIGAALRASEQRFRATFENAAVGIAHVGVDGTWLRVNDRVCEILGYTRDELLAGTFQDLTHAEDFPAHRALFDAMVQGGSDGYQTEARHRHKNGHLAWIHLTTSLQRDGDGRPKYGIAIIQDITARKAAEQALRDADQSKDQFLAVLGHELRNPMAPLRTGLDILLHSPPSPERLHQILPMMDRQLAHLTRLVDDLLDLSRIRRGAIELRRSPHPLRLSIAAAVEQSRPLIEQRGHRLILEDSPADPEVNADVERLTQVFANLLDNAAKYMEPGGTVHLSSTETDGLAVVRVRDQGRGIPYEALEQVFDLFSRVSEHRDTVGGLGIGLALARRLVEMHGGTLTAHSAGVGQGSEFVVRLPLCAGQPSQVTPE